MSERGCSSAFRKNFDYWYLGNHKNVLGITYSRYYLFLMAHFSFEQKNVKPWSILELWGAWLERRMFFGGRQSIKRTPFPFALVGGVFLHDTSHMYLTAAFSIRALKSFLNQTQREILERSSPWGVVGSHTMMCAKTSSYVEHELLDVVNVPNLPSGLVPGASSPDLGQSHCSWSALLFFRCVDGYPLSPKNIPLTSESSTRSQMMSFQWSYSASIYRSPDQPVTIFHVVGLGWSHTWFSLSPHSSTCGMDLNSLPLPLPKPFVKWLCCPVHQDVISIPRPLCLGHLETCIVSKTADGTVWQGPCVLLFFLMLGYFAMRTWLG